MTSFHTSPPAVRAFVQQFNEAYAMKHSAFEEQFWGTKMALSHGGPYNSDLLTQTKTALEDFLSDSTIIQQAQTYRKELGQNVDMTKQMNNMESDNEEVTVLVRCLDIMLRTCQLLPPEAKTIRESTNELESKLESMRNSMKLGYYYQDETESSSYQFHELSSVGLRNLLRAEPNESIRKAAYEGLRSIGPFVCQNGFVPIIQRRNQLARVLGYEDYYDYTVTQAEGFNKKRLFEILDTLEEGTRPLLHTARTEFENRYGVEALEPWNTSYFMAGSVIHKMDPYFPFSKAVEQYLRSYAAMNISYRGGKLNLDLLDRPNKYSNGFCHWPVPAWVRPDGTWQAAEANFTSLADPKAVGSGLTALTTLMHEAGHAAHFANICQPSPLFSQERAPTSVAYAETQSMFLDSLVGDAAWRAKYARNEKDQPLPFDIIEEEIRATHPFAVFQLRAMLAVSYFEKALYELPDDDVTPERIQSLADEIELRIQGGLSPRPLLSVPHLISDEASCYYQGYTLAEMAVHQTRHYFLQKFGSIVDNPHVGPTLRDAYWECGNSKNFLNLVRDLTGSDLSGEAWTSSLQESVEDKISRQRQEYDQALLQQSISSDKEQWESTLDMILRFVDGDTVIAESTNLGIFGACREFEAFVKRRIEEQTTESK
jgi:oligoendopeptidase F